VKPPAEQLEKLLALRCDERPEGGYWQDFLVEFHHRQRQQTVRKSSVLAFWASVRDGFADLGPSKWFYGAGLTYAALTVGFFLKPHSVETFQPLTAPIHRELPASVPGMKQLDQLNLSPSTQGSPDEQVF